MHKFDYAQTGKVWICKSSSPKKQPVKQKATSKAKNNQQNKKQPLKQKATSRQQQTYTSVTNANLYN